MNLNTALTQIHCDDDGNLSWMRVGCSVALMTGCFSILIQLFLAVVVSISNSDLSELPHIEWMQPIALIGLALTGKAAQKQIEKPETEAK